MGGANRQRYATGILGDEVEGNVLTGDTRKIFVSNVFKTVDESHSARVLIDCKPIRNVLQFKMLSR